MYYYSFLSEKVVHTFSGCAFYQFEPRSLHCGLNPYRDLAFFPPPKSVKRGVYAS
jgi:hypothetical protein